MTGQIREFSYARPDMPGWIRDAAPDWALKAEGAFDPATCSATVSFYSDLLGAVSAGITTQLEQRGRINPAGGETRELEDPIVTLNYPVGRVLEVTAGDLDEVLRAVISARLLLTATATLPVAVAEGVQA